MKTKVFKEGRQDGFTLLELLISLTILSVIVVIVFSGFRLGIRAWEKGEQDLEVRQQYRIVLNLLRRQIASIWVQKNIALSDRIYGLRGDADTMAFVSQVHLIPDNDYGNVFVEYQIKSSSVDSMEGRQKQLMFSERPMTFINPADFSVGNNPGIPLKKEPTDFFVLIPKADRIEFAYLKSYSEDKFVWQDTWNPDEDDLFPRAVRITLVPVRQTPPLSAIIRLDSREEKQKS